MAIHEHWIEAIQTDGFVFAENGCGPQVVQQLLSRSLERIDLVMDALDDRDIGIGSAAGFHELVQRSQGRWDLPISPQDFGVDVRTFPWWPVVEQILGQDAEHSFSGCVYSDPGTPAQEWHIDSPHEAGEHRPAHAINVLMSLQDVAMEMGPTEFVRGSHRLTNHIQNPALSREKLIYQHAAISPDRLVRGTDELPPEKCVCDMPAGSFVVFDDRLMHRGLGNQSAKKRYMAYFSYRQSGYTVNTHFEAQRSVFDHC
jgi:hypothetical protein